MTNETIITEWKRGKKKETIARQYAESVNKMRKVNGDNKKMTPKEALAIVEPIIFKYQFELMKGE